MAHQQTSDEEEVASVPELTRYLTNRSTSKQECEAEKTKKLKYPETDLVKGIIGWEGQDDPKNPMNFTRARKWSLLSLVSLITFVSPLASSMFAPAAGIMAADFGVSEETLISFSVSVFILGYAVSFCHNEPRIKSVFTRNMRIANMAGSSVHSP